MVTGRSRSPVSAPQRWPSQAAAVLLAALVASCGGAGAISTGTAAASAAASAAPRQVASLSRMPSGVAVVGDRVFVAMPRWVEDGAATVFELVDGVPVPYPSAELNSGDAASGALVSVNGLHADSRGWLWMLDNARVDLRPAAPGAPKLVVWDTVEEREVFRYAFDEASAPAAGAFLNDVVVDEPHGFAYISETGMGGTPCILALEVPRGVARRVLVGAPSVLPDPDYTLTVDGAPVTVTRPDGSVAPWHVAVNTLGLDPAGDWLYFGPLSGTTLYRVPTLLLRDAAVSEEARAAAVEAYAEKPASDGMAVAPNGELFVTDVEHGAVVRVRAGAPPEVVVEDESMSFPVAIEAVGDGTLWITSSQLHAMPILHGGVDGRTPPYYVWRADLLGAP
ncbi:MAG: hypothetical protein H6700_00745 [Myxococcales bacterium]|nr:hypothetical protein [Myxococcales bacterium]